MNQYSCTQDLFRDLPNTILLVGNGKMENKAEIIDSYDFVIRFNDFKIEGYEHHVGQKVDAVSFHCSDFTLYHTKYLQPNFEKYLNKAYLFTTSDYYTHNSKNEILHPHRDTKLFSVNNPYDYVSSSRISSGVSIALNLCLFYQRNVHLIGFDGNKTGHYYNPNFNAIEEAKTIGLSAAAHNGERDREILETIKSVKFI